MESLWGSETKVFSFPQTQETWQNDHDDISGEGSMEVMFIMGGASFYPYISLSIWKEIQTCCRVLLVYRVCSFPPLSFIHPSIHAHLWLPAKYKALWSEMIESEIIILQEAVCSISTSKVLWEFRGRKNYCHKRTIKECFIG